MSSNAVELNLHKRNGKAHGKAATLDAATIAEIVAQLKAIEPELVQAPAPAEAAPAPQTVPETAPEKAPEAAPQATTEPAPAPGATGESTEEEPPKASIPHNPQREEFYVFLGESDDMVRGLETVGEPMASLLVANHITPQRLAGVRSLLDGGQAAMDSRGSTMGAEATAIIAMQKAKNLTVIAYTNFREVSRTIFPDPVADRDARLNLALDQRIPGRLILFIDKGRTVLANAKQAPQATRLAAAGFDEERIDEILALFDVLNLLYAARRQAKQTAKDATAVRDATIAEARTAIRQLRSEVAAILKANPGVNPPADF